MNRRTTHLRVGEALDLLGLPPAADGETLRRAFNVAVKAAHPDRPGGDHERLRLVIEAYRLLQLRPPVPNPSPAPASPARAETAAQAKLRRFTAAWAA
jgi:curved DNA-binding protein